jgi:hypothetical protein
MHWTAAWRATTATTAVHHLARRWHLHHSWWLAALPILILVRMTLALETGTAAEATRQPGGNGATALDVDEDAATVDFSRISLDKGALEFVFGLELDKCVATRVASLVLDDRTVDHSAVVGEDGAQRGLGGRVRETRNKERFVRIASRIWIGGGLPGGGLHFDALGVAGGDFGATTRHFLRSFLNHGELR